MVARGWGAGKWGKVGKRLHTLGYKMNKVRGSNIKHGDHC